MANNDQLKQLVNQMPAPDRRGMLTGNMDKQQIEKTAASIASGGKENILGLIALLGEPGSEENVKPHYALHCVVNHALIAGDEAMRREFCQTMASQLENKKLLPYNRVYLCQELQWAGRDEACPALGKVLLDEDLTDAAATALVAIGGARAASQLTAALAGAEGKARLNLVDALAALAEPSAADAFRHALTDNDQEVRVAAAVGLAKLGEASATDPLFKAADKAQGWERTQLTKACLVLAEQLAAAGKKEAAKAVYERLQKTRKADNESHVRHAAELGLTRIA